jgi:hypothetical protein
MKFGLMLKMKRFGVQHPISFSLAVTVCLFILIACAFTLGALMSDFPNE